MTYMYDSLYTPFFKSIQERDENEKNLVWVPPGTNGRDDAYTDDLRRLSRRPENRDNIPKEHRTDKFHWMCVLYMFYNTIEQQFYRKKYIESITKNSIFKPEYFLLSFGSCPMHFKEDTIPTDLAEKYWWLIKVLKEMHILKITCFLRNVDVKDPGTTSYDTVSFEQIEKEKRWLSLIPIEQRTYKVCQALVEDNPYNISDVPISILDDNLCIIAIIKSKSVIWPRIPKDKRTLIVWIVAFGMAYDFTNSIPQNVITEYPWVVELIRSIHFTSKRHNIYDY